MPRKVLLPTRLQGSAFRTGDAWIHGLGRGRLRGAGVDHPFHGASSIGVNLSTVHGLAIAYQPNLTPCQYFSHTTSAALFGIPLPSTVMDLPLHISTPANRPCPRGRRVQGHVLDFSHLSEPPDDRQLSAGMPVVSPADTWFQLSAMLPTNDLIAAGDYLITGRRIRGGERSEPLVNRDDLRQAILRHRGNRGAKAAWFALPQLRSNVDSPMETLLRLLLISHGIPEPEANIPTVVDSGRRMLHADLTLERGRVVFEYEGDGHRDKVRFRADILRRELFEAAGRRVIRVTADDIYTDPLAFIARVKAILRSRGAMA